MKDNGRCVCVFTSFMKVLVKHLPLLVIIITMMLIVIATVALTLKQLMVVIMIISTINKEEASETGTQPEKTDQCVL